MEITGKAITVCLPLQQTVKGLLLGGSYKYLKKALSKVNKNLIYRQQLHTELIIIYLLETGLMYLRRYALKLLLESMTLFYFL